MAARDRRSRDQFPPARQERSRLEDVRQPRAGLGRANDPQVSFGRSRKAMGKAAQLALAGDAMNNYRTFHDEIYQPSGDYYIEGDEKPGMSGPHLKDQLGHGQVDDPSNPKARPPGTYNPRSYF